MHFVIYASSSVLVPLVGHSLSLCSLLADLAEDVLASVGCSLTYLS